MRSESLLMSLARTTVFTTTVGVVVDVVVVGVTVVVGVSVVAGVSFVTFVC